MPKYYQIEGLYFHRAKEEGGNIKFNRSGNIDKSTIIETVASRIFAYILGTFILFLGLLFILAIFVADKTDWKPIVPLSIGIFVSLNFVIQGAKERIPEDWDDFIALFHIIEISDRFVSTYCYFFLFSGKRFP